jgi:cell wall-associated NlpC family hydrolase
MNRALLLSFCWLFLVLGAAAQPTDTVTLVFVPMAPVFAQPSEGSEQVTQVLYGDEVRVTDSQGGWVKVLVSHQYRTSEGYPGWMRVKYLERMPRAQKPSIVTVAYPVVSLRTEPSVDALVAEQAYLASRLELHKKGSRVAEGEKWYSIDRGDGPLWVRASQVKVEKPLKPGQGDTVVNLAKLFKGTPYLWGGMTREGIDCSGLMYTCYRVHGVTMPRDADQQFQVGQPVGKDDLRPGDMVFFGKATNDITHVGMYAGDGMFVHASSGRGVVVNRLFEGWYLQHYQGARRVLNRQESRPIVLEP